MSLEQFKSLDKLKEQISLNEEYDREIERLQQNRIIYAQYNKEREKRILEENKRRNPGQ